jgi:hypothetical protein
MSSASSSRLYQNQLRLRIKKAKQVMDSGRFRRRFFFFAHPMRNGADQSNLSS